MLKIIYMNPTVRSALQQAGVLDEQAILDWSRGERIVRKNWADAFKCDIEGIGTVYVKRYFSEPNRPWGGFRKNPAIREYRCSAALSRLGVPQAEPLLTAIAYDRPGVVKCGLYMMREVKDAAGLDVLLERMQSSPDTPLLETIADQLKKLLDTMHRGGFCHWDLKPRNILVTRESSGKVILTPIDARSGKRIRFYNWRACIERERRFLLREPLLRPYFEAVHIPATIELTDSDNRRHSLECRHILRAIKGRRTVFEGSYQGRPVIVKRFEDMFSAFRCRRERRGLERLATYGLCAPAVLLAGRDEKGRHVLVLEKIEKAVDALTAVNAAVSPEAEQVILHRVFAAIARLHQAGIAQYDLHLGNFLLTDDYVYAIDPACMRFGHKPIPSAKSRRQLAMILATLRFGNFTTYRELVEAYCTARGLSYSPELLEVVQTLTERRRQKMMPHALKKTLRNSKSFRVLKTPRGRTIFNAAVFDVDSMHRLIRDLEVVFRNGRYAGENAAGRTVISVFEGRQYTVTRYNSLSGWQRIAAIFCSSAARRQWLTLWKTRYSGKPSLVPVALIDPRPALSLKTAWLVAYNADQKAP